MNKDEMYKEMDRLFALRDAVLNHYDEITKNLDNLTDRQRDEILIFKELRSIYMQGR